MLHVIREAGLILCWLTGRLYNFKKNCNQLILRIHVHLPLTFHVRLFYLYAKALSISQCSISNLNILMCFSFEGFIHIAVQRPVYDKIINLRSRDSDSLPYKLADAYRIHRNMTPWSHASDVSHRKFQNFVKILKPFQTHRESFVLTLCM